MNKDRGKDNWTEGEVMRKRSSRFVREEENLQVYRKSSQVFFMIFAFLVPPIWVTMKWASSIKGAIDVEKLRLWVDMSNEIYPCTTSPFSVLLSVYSLLATLAVGVALSDGGAPSFRRFGRFSYWCSVGSCIVVSFLSPSVFKHLHFFAGFLTLVGSLFLSYGLGRFCVTVSDLEIFAQTKSLLEEQYRSVKKKLRQYENLNKAQSSCARWSARAVLASVLAVVIMIQCAAYAIGLSPLSQNKEIYTVGFHFIFFIFFTSMTVSFYFFSISLTWAGEQTSPSSLIVVLVSVVMVGMITALPASFVEGGQFWGIVILSFISAFLSCVPAICARCFDRNRKWRFFRLVFPAILSYRYRQYGNQLHSIQQSLSSTRRKIKKMQRL